MMKLTSGLGNSRASFKDEDLEQAVAVTTQGHQRLEARLVFVTRSSARPRLLGGNSIMRDHE